MFRRLFEFVLNFSGKSQHICIEKFVYKAVKVSDAHGAQVLPGGSLSV